MLTIKLELHSIQLNCIQDLQWAKLDHWSTVHCISHLHIGRTDMAINSGVDSTDSSQWPFPSGSVLGQHQYDVPLFNVRLSLPPFLSWAE